MAGKKKKQVAKRGKKKLVKKSKNVQKVDLRQQILPFFSSRASTSSATLQVEQTEASFVEFESSNSSFATDLHRRLSGTTLSSGSFEMKRRCTDEGGPLAKRSAAETSHESLEGIDEVYYSDGSEREMSFDEEDSGLENKRFMGYQIELDSVDTAEATTKPPQLDEKLCRGVGDPSEIWNLMCKKDDLERINVADVIIDRHTRAVLVDWMMEVCESEKQHRQTFHLSVNYLDRFLAAHGEIEVESLQCLGTAALFIASKYEEIYPPKLDIFVEYTDGACTAETVEKMETLVLHKLDWSLSVMTSVHWLSTFCQLMPSKKVQEEEESSHYSEKPILLPKFLRDQFMSLAKILDVAVLDMDHLKFSYRELAAAVLFAEYEPHSLIEKVTGYSYEEMQHAIDWIYPMTYNFPIPRTLAALGNPLPNVADVSSDEWHDIQTHGNITVEREFTDLCNFRKELEQQKIEARKLLGTQRRASRRTLRPTNKPMAV